MKRSEGKLQRKRRNKTYESTWFSKDKMTGNGEVLKALSAIASITSCGRTEVACWYQVIMNYTCNPICSFFCTLKGISVVMVNPWVIKGSSSWGRPFQQSNSIQRQPVSSTCLYISTDEFPVSWPAKSHIIYKEKITRDTLEKRSSLPPKLNVHNLWVEIS